MFLPISSISFLQDSSPLLLTYSDKGSASQDFLPMVLLHLQTMDSPLIMDLLLRLMDLHLLHLMDTHLHQMDSLPLQMGSLLLKMDLHLHLQIMASPHHLMDLLRLQVKGALEFQTMASLLVTDSEHLKAGTHIKAYRINKVSNNINLAPPPIMVSTKLKAPNSLN